MNAVIVANGQLEANTRLQELWAGADLRLAADGGARNARRFLGGAPHITIGDLDSLDDETRTWLEVSGCEFVRHPPAKDETDLELALNLAQARGANEITILGAVGGRADHFLANVLLLTRMPHVRMADGASEMWIASGEGVVNGTKGDVVSLIPLDRVVAGITTTGLEYPLRDETLERGSTRGISNVMLGERATIVSAQGVLLLVHGTPHP